MMPTGHPDLQNLALAVVHTFEIQDLSKKANFLIKLKGDDGAHDLCKRGKCHAVKF